MTTKAAAEWLTGVVVSDLRVACAKGHPAWDRPDIAFGAYIEWSDSTAVYGERISSSLDNLKVTFDLVVITANEIALWAMLDRLEAMAETRTRATIDSETCRVRFGPISRASNSFDVETLRYAAETTIQIVR